MARFTGLICQMVRLLQGRNCMQMKSMDSANPKGFENEVQAF